MKTEPTARPDAFPQAGSRVGIQLLVACGGVAALSWEVLWQLEASLALGLSAHQEPTLDQDAFRA